MFKMEYLTHLRSPTYASQTYYNYVCVKKSTDLQLSNYQFMKLINEYCA